MNISLREGDSGWARAGRSECRLSLGRARVVDSVGDWGKAIFVDFYMTCHFLALLSRQAGNSG